MNKPIRRLLIALAAISTASLIPLQAQAAEAWPSKPVKMVVPAPPGGPTDTMARWLADKLSQILPHQVYTFNQPGANGMIAASAVATAPPDGYTVFFGFQGPLAANYALYDNVPYSIEKDFVAVSRWAEIPNVLLVNKNVPADNLKDLIALAKKDGKGWFFGSGGNGSSTHIAGELLNKRAGMNMTHIPYKGAQPSLVDLIGGEIPIAMTGTVDALRHVQSGTLKPLAVTSNERIPAMPDIPTISEAALPGFYVSPWFGVVAPAGTPKEAIDGLNAAIAKAGEDPELKKRIEDLGGRITTGPAEEFSAFLKQDVSHWAELIRESGARVD